MESKDGPEGRKKFQGEQLPPLTPYIPRLWPKFSKQNISKKDLY